ncbi:MAG: glycosyltransferase [Chloroflexi bacterium]|nr:glycosyltransferase [Chloroflexota bacterium]
MADQQLKIAMLSVHSCPVGTLGTRDTGGMSVYITELASALGRLGHLVDIYTRVHDPRDRQIYALGRDVQLIHLKAGENEQIHKLAVYTHLPDFSCGIEAFRKENNLQYDIVFSHYWLSAWVGEYLQQWWHTPHVTMFHTLGAVKNITGIGEDEPELRIETEKELARNCFHIIAPTEKEKEGLVIHYGAPSEKISIVPCGVNLELFKPTGKEKAKRELGLGDDKVILFVGRIEPVKGIEQLVQAIPLLQSAKNIKLVIIGGEGNSPYEMKQLRRLCGELDIEDKVAFYGLVKQDRLPGFYSAADVCVISSYYESFGLVALESLACGTPVVATDVGGSRSVIREGETGYVVADNEPHHLAEKIDLLLSRRSPDINSALAIRASVSKYSWDNIAETIAREFQTALASFMAPVPH